MSKTCAACGRPENEHNLAEALLCVAATTPTPLKTAKKHGWVVSALKVSGGMLMMRKGGGKPAAVLTSKGLVVRCPWKGVAS